MAKVWRRSLGTSKRDQGVRTPKAPQNRKKVVLAQPKVIKKLTLWQRILKWVRRRRNV